MQLIKMLLLPFSPCMHGFPPGVQRHSNLPIGVNMVVNDCSAVCASPPNTFVIYHYLYVVCAGSLTLASLRHP